MAVKELERCDASASAIGDEPSTIIAHINLQRVSSVLPVLALEVVKVGNSNVLL